jgi:lysozyme|tara:strand:+ start:757 stop:1221 length:465 start_codon:yes stop_codon:yes gene_type:complete
MNRDRLYKQLKSDEGHVCEVYRDHLGYLTFGIGHLVTQKDPEADWPLGTSVSEERVKECFDRDVETSITEIKFLVKDLDDKPDIVQEILVNMLFNLGYNRLSLFKKFLKAIDENDWTEAAKEGRDSRWYKQVTNRAERLMNKLETLNINYLDHV